MSRLLLLVILTFGCGRLGTGDDDKPVPPPVQNPSPPSYPSKINIVEQQQIMSFHKLKRCWHNVEDLRWNPEIADIAQKYANECRFFRESQDWYGENVAHSKNLDLIRTMDGWYMQFLQFPYGSENGSETTEEFSQMVWRLTTDIGCGIAVCNGERLLKCFYATKGNIKGQYQRNVFPLKSDISKCGIF